MFDKIVAWDNVVDAHRRSLLGKGKFKAGAPKFNQNETVNLRALQKDMAEGTYRPGKYIEFLVKDPKERLIHAPLYRDKIAQHMVNNVLREFYEPKFIFDSYACIRGKGNARALQRIHQFIKQAKWLYGEGAYLCKIDIQKFFYRIDHDVLKGIIATDVPCRHTTALLNAIIDSSPSPVGLPLGNMSSQLLANVTLNKADHYAKRALKCHFYVRYADDIFLILQSKEEAASVMEAMTVFLRDHLRLTAHPRKTYVCPAFRGFNALGFRVYPTHILLSRHNKNRFIREHGQGKKQISSTVAWLSFAGRASVKTLFNSVYGDDYHDLFQSTHKALRGVPFSSEI